MNANLFANAIGKVKHQPSQKETAKTATESKTSGSDILSRIKRPAGAPSLVTKDPVGGRAQRLDHSAPYSRSDVEKIKEKLGCRFVPKSEVKWKHDLCPEQSRPTYRVFVRNLPEKAGYAEVKEFFGKFGDISGLQVERGTADVYFAGKEGALKAAEEANQAAFDGKKIKVSFCDETKARVSSVSEDSKPKEEKASRMESDNKALDDPHSILARIKKSS